MYMCVCVCMCVCNNIRVYVCAFIRPCVLRTHIMRMYWTQLTHKRVHTYTNIYINPLTLIYPYLYLHMNMHINTHTHTHTHIYIYIYIYIYKCAHVCTYIYEYICT